MSQKRFNTSPNVTIEITANFKPVLKVWQAGLYCELYQGITEVILSIQTQNYIQVWRGVPLFWLWKNSMKTIIFLEAFPYVLLFQLSFKMFQMVHRSRLMGSGGTSTPNVNIFIGNPVWMNNFKCQMLIILQKQFYIQSC